MVCNGWVGTGKGRFSTNNELASYPRTLTCLQTLTLSMSGPMVSPSGRSQAMETHLWRILKYKKLWMLPKMALFSIQGLYMQVNAVAHTPVTDSMHAQQTYPLYIPQNQSC